VSTFLETVTLETIALLPDGRPILSYGTRGHDPALTGGLSSALYSFTQEIDLRKTPADGMKIDVPGGGKLVLRRAVLSGREVFVSVVVRGIVNDQVVSWMSDFGRNLGETITSVKDWRDIAKGSCTSLFESKADIYMETVKRWRASTKMRPVVSVDFKDVIRFALSALGKTLDLSQCFIKNVSKPNVTLSSEEISTLVSKEIIVLAADQDLFLALNARGDYFEAALGTAAELKELRPRALIEAQRTLEEVKKSFGESVGGSINGDTAFFKLPERKDVWTNEILQAVYNRMAKRVPHLLLAHPLLNGIGDVRGLRELAAEFVESFLVEKGPYGMMKKVLSIIKTDPGVTRILSSFIEMYGPSLNEQAACFFGILAGKEEVKKALSTLPESDTLSRSFAKSLMDCVSREAIINGSPEWIEVRNRVYATLVQRYAQILEEMLLQRGMFIEKATTIRNKLQSLISTYQVISAVNALAQHKWKVVSGHGFIPTYTELISTGMTKNIITRENSSYIIEGEKYPETALFQDSKILRKLWSNWNILSEALKDKMSKILKDEFYLPIQLFIEKYHKSMMENFQRYAAYVKEVGSGNPATFELRNPEAKRSIYDPLSDESEKMYNSIVSLFGKSTSYLENSMKSISKAEGGKRVAIAKEAYYTLHQLESQYIESPRTDLTSQLDATFDRVIKSLDPEILSIKEKIDSALKLTPASLGYADGSLEAPEVAASSYKLPPIDEFFSGGYSEILRTYAFVALGLGVPTKIVERGLLQLRDRKNVSPILKPLLKMKESNVDRLVSMHLSEYVKMFVENAFLFASRHIDESYFPKLQLDSRNIGSVPSELMDDPADYIGRPSGIEWTDNGTNWVLRIATQLRPTGEPKSLQETLNDQFAQILQQKYGSTFELLIRIADMLSPDVSKRVEESIRKLQSSLTPAT
jgi:hypothetical protein